MSLDNIQLSGQTCSILFSHNLIEDSASNATSTSQKKIEINSLGENEKKLLFLVNVPDHKFLPDNEMELLTNLIHACKLSMADLALVNFSVNRYHYSQFISQFHPKKVLAFGVTTAELGLPFEIPHFQIQTFQDQVYLFCPPLKDFLNNVAIKKELWKSLQKLFF